MPEIAPEPVKVAPVLIAVIEKGGVVVGEFLLQGVTEFFTAIPFFRGMKKPTNRAASHNLQHTAATPHTAYKPPLIDLRPLFRSAQSDPVAPSIPELV